MDVSHRIGHQVLGNLAIHLGHGLRAAWQLGGKEGPHVDRHFAPHRAVTHITKKGDGVIDDPV